MLDIFNWKKDFEKFGYKFNFVYLLFIFSFLSAVAEILSLSFFIPIFEIFLTSDNANTLNNESLSYYFYIIFVTIKLDYNLFNLLLVSFLFFTFSRFLIFFSSYLNVYFETKITKEIRDLMLEKYLQANSEYLDEVITSDFINIAQVQIKQAIAKVFLKIKFSVFFVSALVSILALLALSVKLTFLTLIISIIPVFFSSFWIKKSRYVGKEHSISEKKITNYLMSRLKALKIIFISNSSKLEKINYSNLTDKTRKLLLLNQILKLKTQTFMEVSSILIALSLAYAAIIYFNIDVELIFLYLLISIRLIPVIKNLLASYQSIRANIGSMELVQNFFYEIKNNIYSVNKKNSNSFIKLENISNLKFENVYYNYNKNKKNILKNLNFEINKNSFNLLIGPSGAGKSTILDIFSTFRHPTKGQYLINNYNYSVFNPVEIKQQISYLPQEIVFFEDNLYDHITYNKKYDKQLLETAIDLSGVSQFININQNLKKIKLNENASNFSGGQKQRIDLARIIYENKSIIILDEPTNQLDYEQENIFIKNICNIVRERKMIAIMITHKIELGKFADKIILLNEGTVVSEGYHAEIIEKAKWYKEKFK